MNLSNIVEGQVLKNYKELCETLGVAPKGGKSKIAHLRELERHMDIEQKGYKLIIHTIYSEPIPKESRSVYQLFLQKILVDQFIKHYETTGEHSLVTTKHWFFISSNMVNNKYLGGKSKKSSFDISIPIVEDFYRVMDDKLEGLLNTAFRQLANKSIIDFNPVIVTNVGIADDDFRLALLDAEYLALKEMRLSGRHEVIKKGLWNEFQHTAVKFLPSKYSDVESYYRGYRIIFSNYIFEQRNQLENTLKSMELYNQLNRLIQQEHMKSVQKRQLVLEDAVGKSFSTLSLADQCRLEHIDEYEDGNRKLLEEVINREL